MPGSSDNPARIECGVLEPLSAAGRLLGWQMEHLDRQAGTLRCSFAADERFLNPVGVVQGGLLAAMLDETMSPLAALLQERPLFCQTLEMKVSFLSPAPPGRIVGEANFVKVGRTIAFVEGRLLAPEGEVIAIASLTARLLNRSHLSSS